MLRRILIGVSTVLAALALSAGTANAHTVGEPDDPTAMGSE